jgi:hypothetical protein
MVLPPSASLEDMKERWLKVTAPLSKVLAEQDRGANRKDIITHANTLLCLASELMSNYAELLLAHQEKKLARAAYATRNLLELAIWTDYCCRSSANANKFAEDTLRDALGLVRAFENIVTAFPLAMKGTETAVISEATKSLESVARDSGIEAFDERYLRVNQAATALGRDAALAYKNFYSILSKFVHPTAFLVNTVFGPELSQPVSSGFLQIGCALSNEAFAQIEKVHPVFLPS